MRPADTTPEAWNIFLKAQREMTPGQKMRAVFEFSEMLLKLAESEIRSRFPDATESEIFLRAASRRLDRETMIKVYGWDPNSDGRNANGRPSLI